VHGLLIGGSHATRSRYHDEVQRRIDNHRLRESITLLGHREDLKEILAVSDLTLALSEEPEAFGRVTLESLSLGTPVLGYAHGGTGEILRRLYPEGAVEPHDLESVIDRARRLLKDAPPVPAEHPYALETMLARTLDVYQSLAARV
jgi:glycosyltransferase involved in cell wall biosynthesis